MGLSEKKLFIFDLDGVIYRDADPIESGIACVQKLQTLGSAVAFFTNNSTKSPQSYAEKLATMGLEISSEQVSTSSIIAASFLKLLYSNGSVFVIGEMGLISAMKDVGFEILNEKFPNLDEEKLVPSDIMADFVIVGLDQGVTYNKFRMAMMLIMNGAPFLQPMMMQIFPCPGHYGQEQERTLHFSVLLAENLRKDLWKTPCGRNSKHFRIFPNATSGCRIYWR